MRFRKLRIAWSVFWGLACVLLTVLWVRSYWWADFTDRRSSINLCSMEGKVLVGCTLFEIDIKDPTPAKAANPPKMNGLPRFGFYNASMSDWVFIFLDDGRVLPYWLCIVITATLDAAPWLRCRFSLRTLLIAITAVAVVLGLIVYATK